MRLIDADELMKELGITNMSCEKCEWGKSFGGELFGCSRGDDFTDACAAIENAPTIEKVPVINISSVVRCNDCIHAFGSMTKDGLYGGLVCDYMDNHVDENFYCAYGEKSE